MDERGRLALMVAMAALLVGAFADGLLRVTPWGLNAALWIVLLVTVIALLAGHREAPLMGEGRVMALPALLFGLFIAWRDSPTLKSMDIVAVLVCLGLMMAHGLRGRIRIGGTLEYAQAVLAAARESLTGAQSLIKQDIGWDRLPRGKWSQTLGAAGRGLLIALPVLALFGWLLVSADAVFARYALDLTRFDVSDGATHLAVTLMCAWAVAGYLRGLLLKDSADPVETVAEDTRRGIIRIGAVEILTVLTLLDLLFLTFVIVQVRYLFGGHELVQARAGLTYAQYARQGFFELVWAVALALPLLMFAHTTVDITRRSARRTFNAASGLLVVLLLVVLASAAQRMRLYQAEYGLTELRFYTSAFMVWLALIFVWFCVTVLRGQRDRFAFGGLIGALAGIALLHVVNPDAVIAQTNIARAKEGRPVDLRHAIGLSDDAVPALIQGLPQLPRTSRADLEWALQHRFSRPDWSPDWRAWSISRERAMAAVLELQPGPSGVPDIHGASSPWSKQPVEQAARGASSPWSKQPVIP